LEKEDFLGFHQAVPIQSVAGFPFAAIPVIVFLLDRQ
jgi:hypothetical protein